MFVSLSVGRIIQKLLGRLSSEYGEGCNMGQRRPVNLGADLFQTAETALFYLH